MKAFGRQQEKKTQTVRVQIFGRMDLWPSGTSVTKAQICSSLLTSTQILSRAVWEEKSHTNKQLPRLCWTIETLSMWMKLPLVLRSLDAIFQSAFTTSAACRTHHALYALLSWPSLKQRGQQHWLVFIYEAALLTSYLLSYPFCFCLVSPVENLHPVGFCSDQYLVGKKTTTFSWFWNNL